MSRSVLCFALFATADAFRKINENLNAHADDMNILEWDSSLQAEVSSLLSPEEVTSELQLEQRPPYKYVQLVGLSLYTFPQNYGTNNNFYSGVDQILKTYRGHHSNQMRDVKTRVNFMIHMMQVAYGSRMVSHSPEVLKIFLAPEFFFRGPKGAYNMNSLNGCDDPHTYQVHKVCNAPILSILLKLKKEVVKAQWADWLFVFGTIVAYRPGETSWDQTQYWNFAPVMRGGSAANHHIVAKTYVSGIDFVKCTSPGSRCVEEPQKRGISSYALFTNQQRFALSNLGFELQNNNQFETDGMLFGLEVCLDHSQHVLQRKGSASNIDVHLIVSAGMSIKYRAGRGPVFLQDGGYMTRTQYLCSGCNYLGRGTSEADGYGQQFAVQSPGEHNFDANEKRMIQQNQKGTSHTYDRSTDKWFSTRGFATEGTGFGIDPRFSDALLNGIFAKDHYGPKINIGPAFQISSRANSYPPRFHKAASGPLVAGRSASVGATPTRARCVDLPVTSYNDPKTKRPLSCVELQRFCAQLPGVRLVCPRACGQC